jgi:hypothetical protein
MSASAEIVGDANNDGRITTADSVIALQMSVGSITPDLERADVNADGKISSLDALMMLTMAQKTQVCVNAPDADPDRLQRSTSMCWARSETPASWTYPMDDSLILD